MSHTFTEKSPFGGAGSATTHTVTIVDAISTDSHLHEDSPSSNLPATHGDTPSPRSPTTSSASSDPLTSTLQASSAATIPQLMLSTSEPTHGLGHPTRAVTTTSSFSLPSPPPPSARPDDASQLRFGTLGPHLPASTPTTSTDGKKGVQLATMIGPRVCLQVL